MSINKQKGRYKVVNVVSERISFIGTADEIAREFNCSTSSVYNASAYGLPFCTLYEVYPEFDEFSGKRRCRKCGKVKPISEFIKPNSKYTCRSCIYEYNRQWRKEHNYKKPKKKKE